MDEIEQEQQRDLIDYLGALVVSTEPDDADVDAVVPDSLAGHA